VPFCHSICGYCDFCRVRYNEKQAEWYLQVLKKERDHFSYGDTLTTLYLGGGTPTSLSDDQFARLLAICQQSKPVAEYTVEANPESLSSEKIAIMKAHGVNRVSLGIQASQDGLLKRIGRHHSFAQVRTCISSLRKAKIENISGDLMYGLPSQSLDDFKVSLKALCDLRLPHLSLYSLTLEEGSLFYKQGQKQVSAQAEEEFYFTALELLKKQGYIQYEISSFCLPGFQSRHNLHYWDYGDFLGLGPGAASKAGAHRWQNARRFKDYEAGLRDEDIKLSLSEQHFEFVMMNLRKKAGFAMKTFQSRYGLPFDSAFLMTNRLLRQGKLKKYQQAGTEFLCVSDDWYPLLNDVLTEFL